MNILFQLLIMNWRVKISTDCHHNIKTCQTCFQFILRFPVGTGIAGYVAETGETLNVRDAYTDPRFNRAIDEQVGSLFESLICL